MYVLTNPLLYLVDFVVILNVRYIYLLTHSSGSLLMCVALIVYVATKPFVFFNPSGVF